MSAADQNLTTLLLVVIATPAKAGGSNLQPSTLREIDGWRLPRRFAPRNDEDINPKPQRQPQRP